MTGPVFVTGGSGFLGSFFIAHLLGQGIPVVALVREPLEAKLIPNLHAAAGPCHGAAKLPLELLRGVQGDVKQAGLGMAESEYTSLSRHSPDSLLVRGNHSTVPPSRERDHFRGRLIT